jgi:hypothetical protein
VYEFFEFFFEFVPMPFFFQLKFQLPSRATNPCDSCGHGAAFSHPRTRHKPCATHRGSLDRVSSVAGKVVRRTRMIQDRRLQRRPREDPERRPALPAPQSWQR